MTDLPSSGVIQRPLIKVNGAVLAPEKINDLIDCRVEQAVARAAQATLRFFDTEFKLMDSDLLKIGTQLTISLASGATMKPVFTGEVISEGIEMGPRNEPVLIVTAYDRAHRMARNTVSKVYTNQTYSDVLSEIVGRSGLTLQAPAMTQTFEHMIQVGDDTSMLDEIAIRTGHVWYVDASKLVLTPAKVAGAADVTVTMGESLRRLRATATASTVSESVEVRSWDAKSKVAIVGQSTASPEKLNSTPLLASTRTGAKQSFGASKRATSSRSTLSTAEADTVAKSLHQRAVSDEMSVRGECFGNSAIKAGGTIELDGVGTKLKGRYFVTSVEHVYSGSEYKTRFTSAGTSPSTLVDLLGGGRTTWHRQGPISGVVCELGEGEFFGKVKVKLATGGENILTGWARLLSVGAGPERGLMVIPAINDEVLVTFEDGDIRRPVVIGGLWNGKDKPPPAPAVDNGKVVEWALQSRLGHTMTFRDGDADPKKNIELALADKTIKLFLGTDKVELFAKDGKPLQIKSGDASITFTAAGDIEIKGKTIKITSTADTEVTGANVKVTGNSKVSLKGNAGLDAAGATVKIEGQSMTEIKGALVKIN